jgi:hypothetical protein
MSEESESGSQWTQAARAAYAASAEQLVVALREHVTLTLDRAGRQAEHVAYSSSADRLLRAAAAFDDAEFDWCGSSPLGIEGDADEVDEDDEDDEDNEDDVAIDGDVLTVVGRWDYLVTDAAAVIEAGRAAYARSWPGDTEEDGMIAVPDPSAAAQEIAHADGWSALDITPGLEPIASTASVIVHQDDSAAWIDDDEDPFTIAREG